MADAVEVIRSAVLEGIPHGFLGRRGGVSEGTVAGLNVGLGAGDDEAAVSANRGLAVAHVLPGARLATVCQVHSAAAVTVVEPWPMAARPQADAMATNRPGVLLGIVTADCAPVLLADRAARVVGAAHAGWRGAEGGVLEAAVSEMEKLGAKRDRIVAAIGPTIAQSSYEVDDAFRSRMLRNDPLNLQFFAAGAPGHCQFDLPAYVAHRLKLLGIHRIDDLGLDTYSDPARFYSFRHATHQGEANYGRQFSLIGLAP